MEKGTRTSAMVLENVKKVYTGRPGCMCGCLGKYSYPETNRKESDERGGTVSERSVKILFNKIINHPKVEFADDGQYAVLETDSRQLVVYFR